MKDEETLIGSVIFIIIGLYELYLGQALAGILLTAIGIVVSNQVRKWIWEGIKFAYSLVTRQNTSGQKQTMFHSPGGMQQQAGRDIKVIVNNYGKEIQEFTPARRSIDDKKVLLNHIYKKMLKAVQSVNQAANAGLENKRDFDRISQDIRDYETANNESDLELASERELKKKLDAVAIALNDTAQELSLKLNDEKFKEGLHGTKSFAFVIKFEDAVKEMKNYFK